MKLSIKQNCGMTELLMILPLFLGMICIIVWIGFLLVAKSKMEKHAWVIQTKQTYTMDVNPKEMNPKYELENNMSMRQLAQIGSMFRGNLPASFRAFLAKNITEYKTLKWNGESPEVIQHSFNSAFETPLMDRTHEQTSSNILPYSFDADLIVADTSMMGLEFVKNGMYKEALINAGFGSTYSFRRLGFKELNDADVPLAKVAEVLANLDISKDFSDEVKRWMGN
jgi:hypothetical protein